ncbi:MAG: hypothetical protein H6707_09535 [Deltaproteobacteria bacterium]|nr:hypothetical protein [Deltaproteobacteria bacterium]
MFRHSIRALALGAALASAACQPLTAEGPSEGAVGKGENTYGLTACQAKQLLAFINDCKNGDDQLAAIGFYSNHRSSLIAVRAGSDGNCDGDILFGTLSQVVSDVKYVGAKTIERVGQTFSDDACATPSATADVVFSPHSSIADSHLPRIARAINSAKHNIDIAIYNLSVPSKIDETDSDEIIAALKRAKDRGVTIRLLFHPAQADRKVCDPKYSDYSASKCPATASVLIEKHTGLPVRFSTMSKELHHKFMIVDGPFSDVAAANDATLITGSGNWTSGAATLYDENTVFLKNVPELVLRYQHEFNTLYKQSYDFARPGEPASKRINSIELDPATFDKSDEADAVFTSANMNTNKQSLSYNSGSFKVADRIAAEISKAEVSVDIASGHFRSYRIYEALIALKKQKPHVTIRVYIDGQEYQSAYMRSQEVEDTNACLSKATTAQATRACYDKGRHLGRDLIIDDLDGDGQPGDIDLRLKYYAYYWYYRFPQMHNKYAIIDGKTLLTGSFNYSFSAETNVIENVAILRAPRFAQLIAQYSKSFEEIWNTDKDEALYNEYLDRAKSAERIATKFEPMALNWQNIEDLKAEIKSNCPTVATKAYIDGFERSPYAHSFCLRSGSYPADYFGNDD